MSYYSITNTSAIGIGYSFLGVVVFKFLKFLHTHNLPFFLRIGTILESHSMYLASLMNPACNSLSISSFTFKITSFAILRGGCWCGMCSFLIGSLCSTSVLSKPGNSVQSYAKKSLNLFTTANTSLNCSCVR